MKALALFSERDCGSNLEEIHELKQRLQYMQNQAEILLNIVDVHQATLEEVSQLLQSQVQNIHSYDLHELLRHSQERQKNKGEEFQARGIKQEIAKYSSLIVNSYLGELRSKFEKLLISKRYQLDRMKKTMKNKMEGSQRESKEKNMYDEYASNNMLFEVPIQFQLLKQVMDRSIQVDPPKELIYQIPIQMHQIFEIPIQLKQIYQIPIELAEMKYQANRIYEVPVEIEEIIEIDSDEEIDKIISEIPQFSPFKDNRFNNDQIQSLKLQIKRLHQQIDNLKISKKIYEVPIQLSPLQSYSVNSQQSYIQVPVMIAIQSQQYLQSLTQDKLVSTKYVQSKTSTQVNTQSDLDHQSPFKAKQYQKHSIIVSSPQPIQQTEEMSNIHEESYKNLSSQRKVSLQQIVVKQQSVQTVIKMDQISKSGILKIPALQIVQVPYEVQKIVEKKVNIPVLQIVEVPVQTIPEKLQFERLSSSNAKQHPENIIIKQVPVQVIVQKIIELPPKVIVKQVPYQVIIEKVIVKEVPIQVIIEKEVIVQKIVLKQIPIEVIVQKQVFVDRVIVKQIPIQNIILRDVPVQTVVIKQVPVQMIREVSIDRIVVKEVPVEVIVQKQIFVDRVVVKQIPIEVVIQKEILVQKIIQVPKIIIKQVPYEVMIQHYAELLKENNITKLKTGAIHQQIESQIQILTKQVPVQIYIQKEVQKIVIKQIPVQVIVQRQVFVDRLIVKQVPIQVIVQKEVFIELPPKIIIKQVPIEVEVQKLVHILYQIPIQVKQIQIKQVPIQVIVEKEVIKQIPIFIQTPIELYSQPQSRVIIKEVPQQVVLVQQIEKLVYVPVQVIKQVQVVKTVKQIVEVPVIVYMQQQKKQQMEVLQLGSQSQQKAVKINAQVNIADQPFQNSKLMLQSKQPNHQQVQDIQTIVDRIVQRQVIKIKQVPIEVQVEKQVIKLRQVPTELQIIVIEYIPYEKIVEVPVEVIIQKPVFVQMPVIVIVQIPVEVIVQKPTIINKILQVPIQVVEQKIVQIPVQVVIFKDRIIQVPYEVVTEKIKQIPIEIIKYVELPYQNIVQKEKIVQNKVQIDQIVNLSRQDKSGQISVNQQQQENNEFALRSTNQQQQDKAEYTFNIPFQVKNEQYEITYQIQIDNKELRSGNYQQIIFTIPYLVQQQHQNKQNNRQDVGIVTEPMQDKVRVIEIPIEVQNIDMQNLRKNAQQKYRSYLDDLKQHYEKELGELHQTITSLQTVILESNSQKQYLNEKIQKVALDHEQLQAQLDYLERQTQEITMQLKQEMKLLRLDQQNKNIVIESLHEQVNKLSSISIRTNVIYQLPIEIEVEKETSQQMIQTEDIQLQFQHILMEIPVQLENHQINQQELLQIQQQEHHQLKLNQVNHHIQDNIDRNIQNTKERIIYQLPLEIYVDQQLSNAEIQTEFTVRQDEDIIVVRQMQSNPYDVQMSQTIQKAVIFEIATQIEVIKETADIQMQTQSEIFSPSSRGSLSEEQKQISQEEQDYQQEQYFVQTQKNSKFSDYKHNKGTFTFKKQEKPYSQYFKSRIFQIPIELNLNKISNNIQVQTQASETKQDLLLDPRLSNMFLSRQREIILSHLRIVQAFEPFNIMMMTQTQNTPRKLQNKIFNLGSLDNTLGINHNFSNVQSLTPNQLDGSSSYDKFPPPNINISVIKKQSINSFAGSLDIRDQLLRDDAIASIRMKNKRIQGFQRQQSSQQSDDHGLMAIEQNQTIVSRQRDINRIQTPNLEPHDLNFSEYATLKEKLYEPEDQHNYQELYENCQNQIQELKAQLQEKIDEISQMKIQIDRETSKYQEDIRKLQQQISSLRRMLSEHQLAVEHSKAKISQHEQSKHKLQKKIEMLFENWQKLKEQNEKSQLCLTKEIQRLRTIINQKIAQIKDLKGDEQHQKEIYQAQLHELKEIVNCKNAFITNLEEQLQKSNDRVDQLIDNLEQMRKNINSHNNQIDTAAIYEQQFQRVKESFEDQKKELNYQIYDLKQQIQILKENLTEEITNNHELTNRIAELEKQISENKHDFSSLHHLKSELENNYMQDVKCLNQELQQMKDLVREKDEIIQHYNIPHLHSQPQHKQPLNRSSNESKIRIQYLSKQTSYVSHQENVLNIEMHCRTLQNLLKKYQRIIIDNQSTIQELQDKVYEYLKDALQKEQQAEGLYIKLVDYENTINNILVEKVTLQIQNKRMSKQIDLSEKKLNVLGNRLIEVARQRAEYESDDDYYFD